MTKGYLIESEFSGTFGAALAQKILDNWMKHVGFDLLAIYHATSKMPNF